MDYNQFIRNEDSLVGERFQDMISNPNFNLSGFYLSLSERPNLPIIEPELLDLKPEVLIPNLDIIPAFNKTRDTVEEIYFYSFKLPWVEVTSTKSIDGVEIYVNEKLLPEDYSSSDAIRYSTWFLGYKNELTGEILPCIYGYNTKDIIKTNFSNTIYLPLEFKCNFKLNIPLIEDYINDLEYNNSINDAPDPLYYKSGELDIKVRKMSSYTLSAGVGKLEQGVLKFN